MTNLYDTLGVSKKATEAQLKTAFRKLARETHPDRNKAPGAEARFKEINSAYEVLSDAKKRALYDQFGDASLQSGFDPNFARHAGPRGGFDPRHSSANFDMDDLLGSLFGGARRGPQGPADMRAQLGIDFRTAALGGERELTFDNGQSLKIRIPPGVRDGGTLRLRGKAPGGGDLVLTLGVTPDPRFERKGDDLHTTVRVTLGEALLGGSIEVPTLQNPVRLQVPECSQNGQRLRVRGKGIARKGRAPGDLYVTLEVRLPEHLDAEAREAVKVLERAYARERQSQAA